MKKFSNTIEGKFTLTLFVIIIALFGYYFYSMSGDTNTSSATIEINAQDHVTGDPNGVVTLVEFGDFQCPACGAYHPLVKQVLKNNPTGLKFVFKNFPLTQIHQNALTAAKATEAAALQGKYWEMHDKIYESQNEWSGSLNALDVFTGYAKALSLDTKKFTADVANKSVEDNILAEYKEGTKLGVQGTPTFFLNGKKLSNPQSQEAFDALIKDAIAEAKKTK